MTQAKAAAENRRPGRPSTFDRTELLEKIMHLFWEHGYKNLSFNEIAKKTGLTRASLYNAFESKEALLEAVLAHYDSVAPDASLQHLEKGDSVGAALTEVIERASKVRASDPLSRGCLLVNCLNESMNEDSDLGLKLKAMYERRRVFLRDLMKTAIDQGELPKHTDAEATANLILSFMSGFSTFSKSGSSEQELIALSMLFLRNLGFKL